MLVDTSVLVRTLQPHHHVFRDRAIGLPKRAGTHIVAQNLMRWTGTGHPEKTARMTGEGLEWKRSRDVFLPETPAIYPAWETLVTQHQVMGKPAHDARLVAAMQAHGLTAILTFDRTGFSGYPGIEVIHPDEMRGA